MGRCGNRSFLKLLTDMHLYDKKGSGRAPCHGLPLKLIKQRMRRRDFHKKQAIVI
jgi:hypothetical protein